MLLLAKWSPPSPRMKPVLRILIVEDNADDVFLLTRAFKRIEWDPSFRVVCDGLEAVAYLEGHGDYGDRKTHPIPDLVLLDLNMPRWNGFEVLEWIRKHLPFPHLVVHVLSASSRPSDVRRAYELGANSYVVKPTMMDELVAFVSALRAWHEFVVFAPLAAEPQSDIVLPGFQAPDSNHEAGER